MDVKYIPSDWEKMKEGIGDLIGLRRWGKGMIDDLKAITENLEDAESDIASLDSDGVISFHHTSQKDKFQQLYEDFEVLHRFTGKVGDIVDRTIDQPFYEDIDAFVESMRDLSISNYTTKNRVGATEVKVVYAGYGQQNTLEVPKTEVSIDDLFNGDNFYAEQIKLEYEAWKELNPDQDFSQKEYQLAAVNTRAFEYESIRNHQESKEFWGQIAALVVIVGVSLVCPPAGIALGAAYGTFELSSAVSGKDWISGRELGTGERVFRGLLSPLDIIPGVSSVAKFSGTVKFAHLGDIGISSVKTGIKNSVNNGVTQVRSLVETAGKASTTRLKSAAAVIKDVPNKLKNKLIDDTIEVGRFIDSAVTHGKNIISTRQPLDLAMEGFGNTGSVRMPVENTHAAENYFAAKLGRGTGNRLAGESEIKPLVGKGEQYTNGRKNKLKPNIRYQTGEYGYFYETDGAGRISKFETDNLQLTNREKRLSHSRNTPGKVKGQDHAGHLAGDRFGGSPKIDNLVSQLSDVNLKQYKKIEDEWAAALNDKPPKKVTVDVEILYKEIDVRPKTFIVNYTIDGKSGFKIIEN
ncbi:DNA/RNA non-specific endonuclease [Heyndrickxia sporothermodurans]|uniref:DNA/RNA non-specific endonuclease n=1 Tax=Heyndrickxia sporothermodurans TaxID=46224 RepID=UPI001FD1B3E9|nr:DNA/RNA non-specific endonuclease [Heyndrickxia sporothermodurans]